MTVHSERKTYIVVREEFASSQTMRTVIKQRLSRERRLRNFAAPTRLYCEMRLLATSLDPSIVDIVKARAPTDLPEQRKANLFGQK